jgi:hypothetical protein
LNQPPRASAKGEVVWTTGSVGRKNAANKGRLRVERQQDVASSHSKEDVPPRFLGDDAQSEHVRVESLDVFRIVRIECGLNNGFDLR